MTGACLLFCYVAGTVGLPMPVGVAGAGGACLHGASVSGVCHCSAESILAGQCCCHRQAIASACCAHKGESPAEPHTLSETATPKVAGSCCRQMTSKQGRPADRSGEQLERLTRCPCGPGSADSSLVCTDPRLPTPGIALTGAPQIVGFVVNEPTLAPGGALEPLTPPPRATRVTL